MSLTNVQSPPSKTWTTTEHPEDSAVPPPCLSCLDRARFMVSVPGPSWLIGFLMATVSLLLCWPLAFLDSSKLQPSPVELSDPQIDSMVSNITVHCPAGAFTSPTARGSRMAPWPCRVCPLLYATLECIPKSLPGQRNHCFRTFTAWAWNSTKGEDLELWRRENVTWQFIPHPDGHCSLHSLLEIESHNFPFS